MKAVREQDCNQIERRRGRSLKDEVRLLGQQINCNRPLGTANVAVLDTVAIDYVIISTAALAPLCDFAQFRRWRASSWCVRSLQAAAGRRTGVVS